jgi:cullin 1
MESPVDFDAAIAILQASNKSFRTTRTAPTLEDLETYIREYGLLPLERVLASGVVGSNTGPVQRIRRDIHSLLFTVADNFRAGCVTAERVHALLQVFQRLHQAFLARVATHLMAPMAIDRRLVLFSRYWTAHRLVAEWFTRLFSDVDPGNKAAADFMKQRKYAIFLKSKGVDVMYSVTSQCHKNFKSMVFETLKDTLVQAIHSLVIEDRLGMSIDRSVAKAAIDMFLVMGVCGDKDLNLLANDKDTEKRVIASSSAVTQEFVDTFQTPFALHTREFYESKVAAWIADMDMPSYFALAEKKLDEENKRCLAYLPTTTRIAIMDACRKLFLADHVDDIVERHPTAMPHMLTQAFAEQSATGTWCGVLARMFSLFMGPPEVQEVQVGLDRMARVLFRHYEVTGAAIVQKLATQRVPADDGKPGKVKMNDPEYVAQLLSLLRAGDVLQTAAFQLDVDMGRAMWRGMETVLNMDGDHAEILATYVDNVLKGRMGTDKLTEAQIEVALTSIVALLRYLADKDLFREHYCIMLAKRMLLQKSVSYDMEVGMLARLKALCGPNFTKKIEDMLADLRVAEDANREYNDARKTMGSLSVVDAFNVLVLKASCWPPMHMFSNVILPPIMVTCIEHYKAYYGAHFQARTLRHAWGQGSAELTVQFTDKMAKTVCCTTLQAVVLLAFNAKPVYTLKYVPEAVPGRVVSVCWIYAGACACARAQGAV